MTREGIRKLVGGYAAGILTEEERRELFAAALEDQELFDELMREEPLREVLADPSSRAELRRTLEKPARGRRLWWWALPASTAVAAAAFALLMIHPVAEQEPVRLAQVREQAKESPPAPPAAVQAPGPPAGRAKAVKPKPEQEVRPQVAQPVPSGRREPDAAAAESVPPADKASAALAPRPEQERGPAGLRIPSERRLERETAVVIAAEPLAFGEQAATGRSPQAPAPAAPAGPRTIVLQGAAGARAAFYGIAEKAQTAARRTAAAREPRLGLRYTREAGVLTVEPNVAVRLRVFDGAREIFNSPVRARARETIAAPEGRPLRIALEREDTAPLAPAQTIAERDPDERAIYVVADPGATSITVNVP